ncbi:Glutaredoxin-2 [Mactra antiquata]
MAGIQQKVDEKVNSRKVYVISKSYCPFCKQAKDILKKYTEDIGVWEIDSANDMKAIQKYLETKTGASSVPRVFINGEFIGGCDKIKSLHSSKELQKMLG